MSGLLSQLAEAIRGGSVRIVDLTQPLGPDTAVIALPPPFALSPGVTIEQISRFDDDGPAWYWNALSFGEHTGTHFDAPGHWISGKDLPDNTTDTIPANRFVGPASVIDVTAEVTQDADYLLTPEELENWEGKHGPLAPGGWVLLHTGWSDRGDAEAFLNIHDDGPHSPGFHTDTIRNLAERDVLGIGVETVGTDAGQAGAFDPAFPAHTLMHGAGKLGLASLCNLDKLPPTGAVVIAAPLKLVEGSGSPLRVIALVEEIAGAR